MKLRNLTVLLVAVVAAAVCFLWPASKDQVEQKQKQDESGQIRSRKRPRVKRERRNQPRSAHVAERLPQEKPVLAADIDEEELDSAMREVLAQLRDALNDADLASARKAVAKLKAAGGTATAGMANWAKHVPKALLNAAVETLGYFGGDAIADLLDFIADDDPDVAQSAIDQLELALQDVTLGDRERAEVIKSVSAVLTDAETLDWMLSSALDARHSVGVETLAFIAEHGTPEAKEMVPSYIDLFTGGEGGTTVAEARAWLKEYPDEPDDDAFYGGQPVSK
jgi:hypothetical protein